VIPTRTTAGSRRHSAVGTTRSREALTRHTLFSRNCRKPIHSRIALRTIMTMLSLLPREPPSSPRTVVRTDPYEEDKTETTTSRSYDHHHQHSSYSRGEDHEEQDAGDGDLSSRERVEQDQECCQTEDINVHDDDDNDGYCTCSIVDDEEREASSATTTVSVSSIGSSVSSSTRRPLLGQEVEEQQQGQAPLVVVLPAIIRLPAPASPIRSCLVNATSTTNKKKRRKGRAAVRGLWPEDKVVVDCTQQSPSTTNKTTTTTSSNNNNTRQLSDRLLSTVFSFLPVQDLVRCENVSRRWQAVSGRSELWTTIDASDYVAELYDKFIVVATNSNSSSQQQDQQPSAASSLQAAVWTTQQLTQTLQSHHCIRYLTIRHVQQRLSADYLHLPLWRLVELTIGQFDHLTDTHLRSLLFLATLRCQSTTTNTTGIRRTLPLARMRLEHCPQLSKDCLTAVRTVCPHAWCSFVENDEPASSFFVSSASSSSLDNLLFSSQNNSGVMPNNNNKAPSSLASLFEEAL
jgi:F-box-like